MRHPPVLACWSSESSAKRFCLNVFNELQQQPQLGLNNHGHTAVQSPDHLFLL